MLHTVHEDVRNVENATVCVGGEPLLEVLRICLLQLRHEAAAVTVHDGRPVQLCLRGASLCLRLGTRRGLVPAGEEGHSLVHRGLRSVKGALHPLRIGAACVLVGAVVIVIHRRVARSADGEVKVEINSVSDASGSIQLLQRGTKLLAIRSVGTEGVVEDRPGLRT